MIPTTIEQIADAIGGAIHGVSDRTACVTCVVTDSRHDQVQSMFVAIRGERVDGHAFAEQAVQRGSIVVLADRIVDAPCIVVPDTVAALGMLASWYRTTYLDCTVVGITGSSGKTSTKDFVHQVCEVAGPTVSARGSFNTDIGVPLTVLEADDSTRYLVLEMGMRGPGHIARLVGVVMPDIAVVTNVGTAHIGELGSQEAIASAKGELVRDLPADAWAVLNADDPFVRAMQTTAQRWMFGETGGAECRAMTVRLDEQARPAFDLVINGASAAVHLQVHGEHAVMNALAAASVGAIIGIPIDAIAAALTAAQARSPWRMEVHRTRRGFRVINDAYNANPESMRAALKALVAMGGSGRTWAVLGEMRELGEQSQVEHDAIGRLIVRLDIDNLICIGEGTKVLHLGASNEGSWGEESRWVPDVDAALATLAAEVQPDDVVLVKASRSVGLDAVATALIDAIGGGAA